MANLWITANGQTIYPELPIGRERIIIARDQEMITGTLRRAFRGEKFRIGPITRGHLSEADRIVWSNALPRNSAFTLVDELGATRTVVVEDYTEDLEETKPATPGGAATTGPAYYRISATVREV